MLRRVLKHADTKTKQISYWSLWRPVLQYGCIVWDQYVKDIKKFERIPNTVLRFVFRIKGQYTEQHWHWKSVWTKERFERNFFYIKTCERGLPIPDLKLIKKSIIHINSLDYLHRRYRLILTFIHSSQGPHEICVVMYANYYFIFFVRQMSEFSRSSFF